MEGIITKDSSNTSWTRPVCISFYVLLYIVHSTSYSVTILINFMSYIQDDILQDIIESYPPVADCKTDKYTYFAHWMIVLVFASVFTTTEHATIVLYRILQHPEVIDELIEEQKEIYGHDIILNKNNNSEEIFTADSIKKLIKLDSVCRESLRTKNEYFQLPHTNSSKQNITLSNGVVIPPGNFLS